MFLLFIKKIGEVKKVLFSFSQFQVVGSALQYGQTADSCSTWWHYPRHCSKGSLFEYDQKRHICSSPSGQALLQLDIPLKCDQSHHSRSIFYHQPLVQLPLVALFE